MTEFSLEAEMFTLLWRICALRLIVQLISHYTLTLEDDHNVTNSDWQWRTDRPYLWYGFFKHVVRQCTQNWTILLISLSCI